MVPNILPEISFQFSRSGGKGGQHVNKVETAVTGIWNIPQSRLLTEEQRTLLLEKLQHRLNAEGDLLVKSQTHRSQGANRDEVVEKILALVGKALTPRKPRIATKPTKGAREQRLESKKRKSDVKKLRGKIEW
jgi:ribosome-associated protein